MSLDKSLRSHGALARHRNVLTRAERLDLLQDEEEREEGDSVFGLRKVAHRKVTTKRHKPAKEEAAPEAAGAEAATAEGGVTPPAQGQKTERAD